MNEQELRNQIAQEVENLITIALENCACLGRDAYGDYIENCKNSILIKIKKHEA